MTVLGILLKVSKRDANRSLVEVVPRGKACWLLERYAALLAAESRLAEWCVASVAF